MHGVTQRTQKNDGKNVTFRYVQIKIIANQIHVKMEQLVRKNRVITTASVRPVGLEKTAKKESWFDLDETWWRSQF